MQFIADQLAGLRRAGIAACAGAVLMFGAAWAQTAAPSRIAEAAPVDYTLGPDDLIAIWAGEAEELNGKTARVEGSGMVTLPLVGGIKAAGLTTTAVSAQIAARLERYFKKPQVVVSISEYRSQPVSIFGSVNTPGIHQLQGRKTLIEMLSMAGGLRNDAGTKAIITRRAEWGPIPVPGASKDPSGGFTTAEIDISSVTEAENPARNITIRPRDVISIPKARLVYVIGEVERSGGFPLQDQEGMSVLQVVSLAGGLRRTASAKNARILRPKGTGAQREEIAVNLKSIMNGQAQDLTLQADEILLIPDNMPKRASIRAAEAALQVVTGVVIWRGAGTR